MLVKILRELCEHVGLADASSVIKTGWMSVAGFDVLIAAQEEDPETVYVQFHFGCVTVGRTLAVYRLMLEANVLIYAQDDGQMALDPDTGGIILMFRVPLQECNAKALADMLRHYADQGHYWRKNIIEATDAMFEGTVRGDYQWLLS